MAENDHLPLTWHIALTTVYALTCYTVMGIEGCALGQPWPLYLHKCVARFVGDRLVPIATFIAKYTLKIVNFPHTRRRPLMANL